MLERKRIYYVRALHIYVSSAHTYSVDLYGRVANPGKKKLYAYDLEFIRPTVLNSDMCIIWKLECKRRMEEVLEIYMKIQSNLREIPGWV